MEIVKIWENAVNAKIFHFMNFFLYGLHLKLTNFLIFKIVVRMFFL